MSINMRHHPNYLRTYRKQSHLQLSDIAFLADTSDSSALSRYEKGERCPSLPILLLYHLLFDVPIEQLFDLQLHELKKVLVTRITDLIDMIESLDTSAKNIARISFLQHALTRLS